MPRVSEIYSLTDVATSLLMEVLDESLSTPSGSEVSVLTSDPEDIKALLAVLDSTARVVPV